MSGFVRPLPPRRERFVFEFVKDLNGTQAAIRAGYGRSSADSEAARLMADPDVQAAVKALQDERARELKLEANEVLRHLVELAIADPNELIQHRRGCCRHCHGNLFGYQRTPAEMERDRVAHEAAELERQRKDPERHQPRVFDEAGGVGYDPRREPHEDCPECFGEGVERIHLADTRHLSGPARRLYAGVKQTKDGVQVLMRDQDKAIELIGRHLAMFKDKVEHDVTENVAAMIAAARKRAGG